VSINLQRPLQTAEWIEGAVGVRAGLKVVSKGFHLCLESGTIQLTDGAVLNHFIFFELWAQN